MTYFLKKLFCYRMCTDIFILHKMDSDSEYIPLISLFESTEPTITLEYTDLHRVLSKNKTKYVVYITAVDGKKYFFDEYNTSEEEPATCGKIEIDTVNRVIGHL